jgi:Mg2+/citrate symporter
MTDLDLDRLGDVWRQQPDPAEMERLRRTAAAVSRRARLALVVDAGMAIALAGVVVLLVLSNPKVQTFVMGAAVILLLLGSNIRQRRLRRVELRSLSGGTEDMLDQSIERVETALKHNRVSILGMGPVLLIGIVFATTAEGRIASLFPAVEDLAMFRTLWVGLAVVIIAGVVVFLTLAIKRGRRELERLRAMREAYRHERETTTS